MRSSSMPASFADADAAASQQMAEEPRRVSYEPGLKTVPTIEHAGPVRPYYYSAKGFSSVTWHKPGAARPSTIRPNSGDSKVIYGLPSRPGVDDIESTESELRGSYNGRGPAAIIAQRRREEPPLTRSPVPVIVSSDGRSKDLVEPTSHDVVDSRQIQKQLDKKHDTQTPHVDSYNRIIISNAQTAKQTLADRQGHGPETDVPSDSLDSDDSASMEEGDIPMRRYIETMYPPLTGKIEKGASERPGWGVFLRKVLLRGEVPAAFSAFCRIWCRYMCVHPRDAHRLGSSNTRSRLRVVVIPRSCLLCPPHRIYATIEVFFASHVTAVRACA